MVHLIMVNMRHTIVTPERIKNDKSPYNTYKHKGLPPHPLSTVTLDALKASIHPTNSNYLFFMLQKDGSHNFAETYDKHLANIRAFRQYQKEKKEKEAKEKSAMAIQLQPSVEKDLLNTDNTKVNREEVNL